MNNYSGDTRAREHNFYLAMAISLAVIVLIGFSRSFFFRPWYPEAVEYAAPETIFYVHGVLFSAWMLFLVSQAFLIRSRNIALHRRIGVFGAVLAAAMVVIGIWGALVGASRPGGFMGVPIPPDVFLTVPFFDMAMFGAFVAWAIARRRDPQSHKRLMLFATINIIEAALARIPLAIVYDNFPMSTFLLSDVFILPIILWDLVTLRRLHWVTIWATVLTIAFQVLRFVIAETEAWLGFARWLIGLVS